MTQVSPNMTKSEEGYLLCKNVKIAHTKPMQYYINDTNDEVTRLVNISNSNIILDKSFYMSLIGKPLVDNHPSEKVDSENYSKYIKGTIVSAYTDGESLIADILVYDKKTQDLIMNGKREVSMQVDATLTKLDDNNYIKNPVTFNHLALVDRGRAGREYKFVDSEDKMEEKEQVISVPTSFFERLFGKKEQKEQENEKPKVFSDMEDTLTELQKTVNTLSEKIVSIENSLKEKEQQNTFSDNEDSIISAICEFVPFRKGMNVELGVKSALNASILSSVGSNVEKLIGEKDIMSMSFADAKGILLSAFELKKAVNSAQVNTQQTQSEQRKTLGYITGADLNKLYDKENK